MDDFQLRPLEPDDEEADAHNDDTFGDDGGAVGDDWKPDARAVGAFEAMHARVRGPNVQGARGGSCPEERHLVSGAASQLGAHSSRLAENERELGAPCPRSLADAHAFPPRDMLGHARGFEESPLPAFFDGGQPGPSSRHDAPSAPQRRAGRGHEAEDSRAGEGVDFYDQGAAGAYRPRGAPFLGRPALSPGGGGAPSSDAAGTRRQMAPEDRPASAAVFPPPHLPSSRRSAATEQLDKMILLKRQQHQLHGLSGSAHGALGGVDASGGPARPPRAGSPDVDGQLRDLVHTHPPPGDRGRASAPASQGDIAARFGRPGEEGAGGERDGRLHAGADRQPLQHESEAQGHPVPPSRIPFASPSGAAPPDGSALHPHGPQGGGELRGGPNVAQDSLTSLSSYLGWPPAEEDERMVQNLLKDANVTAAALAALSAAEAAVAAARAQQRGGVPSCSVSVNVSCSSYSQSGPDAARAVPASASTYRAMSPRSGSEAGGFVASHSRQVPSPAYEEGREGRDAHLDASLAPRLRHAGMPTDDADGRDERDRFPRPFATPGASAPGAALERLPHPHAVALAAPFAAGARSLPPHQPLVVMTEADLLKLMNVKPLHPKPSPGAGPSAHLHAPRADESAGLRGGPEPLPAAGLVSGPQYPADGFRRGTRGEDYAHMRDSRPAGRQGPPPPYPEDFHQTSGELRRQRGVVEPQALGRRPQQGRGSGMGRDPFSACRPPSGRQVGRRPSAGGRGDGRSPSPLPLSSTTPATSSGRERDGRGRGGDVAGAALVQEDKARGVEHQRAVLAALRASSLFPLTKAHQDWVVRQRLADLPPFRLRSRSAAPTPALSADRGPAPQAAASLPAGAYARAGSGRGAAGVSKPAGGGKRECLMTSFDLDHILRMHLAQMAKLPQLQRCSGRWNFRFLMRHQHLGAGPSSAAAGSAAGGGRSASPMDGALERGEQHGSSGGGILATLPSSSLGLEKEILRVFQRQQQEYELLKQHREAWGGRAKGGGLTEVGRRRRAGDASDEEEDEAFSDWPRPPASLPLQFVQRSQAGIGLTISTSRLHHLLLGSLSFSDAAELLQLYVSPTLLLGAANSKHKALGDGKREASLLAALEEDDEELAVEGRGDEDKGAGALTQVEKAQRRLQKKFGKQTYSTVRQPRNCIHLAPSGGHALSQLHATHTTTGAAEEALEDGAERATAVRHQGRDLEAEKDAREAATKRVRALVCGVSATSGGQEKAPGASSAAADGVLARRVVEDAYDLLLEAAALQTEIMECPASHVAARTRLQEQQQHLMMELFEIVTLRHHLAAADSALATSAVATLYFLPFLVDAHIPAASDIATYHWRFLQLQQLQLAESRQPELRAQLEELRAQFSAEMEHGRASSRWMLAGVYALPKGRRLLARALRLMPDAATAALLQILLSSPAILRDICATVDAVLLGVRRARPQAKCRGGEPDKDGAEGSARDKTGQASRHVASATLLDELLLLHDASVAQRGGGAHRGKTHELVSSLVEKSHDEMDDDGEGPACGLYLRLVSRLLQLSSRDGSPRAAAISAAFLVGVCEQMAWGWTVDEAAELLRFRSGCCLLSLLLQLLPAPSSLTGYQERTAALPFLSLVVSGLVRAVQATDKEAANAEEDKKKAPEVLLPFIQTVVQQARAEETRAKAITVAVMELLGAAGAQAMFSSFLSYSA
ncbi:hypothetical protein BESB_003430 [Besnoitia besnoiti]|uniref:Uncharacterized protein n=1 Tax=Besnoitia besnoiti TaxID=94643 RepID=A0A2A9MQ18_BESBE|nr:hypothetical protein BESB_003430 [Besnoitia besnoiti]PFH38002.1 hypothetical protein BESB_003430 [Besnoitia besnoiti]